MFKTLNCLIGVINSFVKLTTSIIKKKLVKFLGSVEVVAEKYLAIQKQWGAPWGANMSE